MIKRTRKDHVKTILQHNPSWNILDIGCGTNPWPEAQTLCDIVNHEEIHAEKRFTCCEASSTPFEDKEFDFVIASHVAEHVEDLRLFLNELQRISKRGYIEVPTPLFDNLTRGNETAHRWWINFNDTSNKIEYIKKRVITKPLYWPEQLTPMEVWFRGSMCLELLWENSIESVEPSLTSEQRKHLDMKQKMLKRNSKHQILFTRDIDGRMRSEEPLDNHD
tara:strand:- start:983 stop:1642 length:660 start_codon:yes stop_codon:yes gene_type:complete